MKFYGRKVNKPSCLIKLDIRKAYDTVEWGFLMEMMLFLEFPGQFIKLVMECVMSTRFSLLISGSKQGYFGACRGLRQGDPISPLLFVIAMEYLSRLLDTLKRNKDFKFHDRCGEIMLNHLIFADDVLIFCNGDFRSIYLMLQCLETFSQASGLTPNPGKTSIYCSGMNARDVQRVVERTGFKEGKLPFTYLGVPITPKKIGRTEGRALIEKMVARVRQWSSRNLSYAGRTVLINSVLVAIQAYWSQLLILPKWIIREINQICRAYLWKGKYDWHGPGAIAWDSLCLPKKWGGLGFKRLDIWNRAACFKHIWAVAQKKDCIWLKWVNHVYLKGTSVWEHQAPNYSSWSWRKMVEILQEVKDDMQKMVGGDYKIAKGYKLFLGEHEKVYWDRQIWNRWNVPKHSFVMWLTIQDRLATRARVGKYMGIEDVGCIFCLECSETCKHLFFKCSWVQDCLKQIKDWLDWCSRGDELKVLIKWVKRSKVSKFRKQVYLTSLAALVYLVWKARNMCIWRADTFDKGMIVQQVKKCVKCRILLVREKIRECIDEEWFCLL